MSFLWSLLFIEVTVSFLLLAILFYYVVFKKEELLLKETFDKIKESSKHTKIAAVLLLLSFFFFIIHEAFEIISLSPKQEDLLFIRHNIIYLPLIFFQAVVLSLIVKALRRT